MRSGKMSQPHFLEECEDDSHTLEMGIWKFSAILEISKFNCRGQNTLHWGVLHIIGKLLKCKWARMGHFDICSISYGKEPRVKLLV